MYFILKFFSTFEKLVIAEILYPLERLKHVIPGRGHPSAGLPVTSVFSGKTHRRDWERTGLPSQS